MAKRIATASDLVERKSNRSGEGSAEARNKSGANVEARDLSKANMGGFVVASFAAVRIV